jgi:ribosomal protein L11 methyltransferase
MSFGTGHHATTYLMAEQMSQLDLEDKRVIDFGTGTGVLAILAEKLGAANIIAIDNDDWSINNARENITANDCRRISLVKAETIVTDKKAAVILANINLNIIVDNLSEIKNAADTGATILFSGIMAHDESIILAALKEVNIKVQEIFNKNGWLAILAKS